MDQTQRMVRDRIVSVLGLPTTRKINFRLGQWTINAASFASVANAFIVVDIEVQVGLSASAKGAEAQYNHLIDALFVPNAHYGTEPFGQAGIVHECVHAFVDMQSISGQTNSANEAAGYVAYVLFLLDAVKTFPTPTLDFGKLTVSIAKSIMNKPGAVVSTKDEIALRKAIAANPHYHGKGITLSSSADSDGLYRHALMRP